MENTIFISGISWNVTNPQFFNGTLKTLLLIFFISAAVSVTLMAFGAIRRNPNDTFVKIMFITFSLAGSLIALTGLTAAIVGAVSVDKANDAASPYEIQLYNIRWDTLDHRTVIIAEAERNGIESTYIIRPDSHDVVTILKNGAIKVFDYNGTTYLCNKQ